MNRADRTDEFTEEKNSPPVTKETLRDLSNKIKISVNVQPLEKESNLASDIYAFSYTVTMVNSSDKIIQLINRHWKVFSADNQIADVKGDGVVGQQPILRPMDSFEYTSWTLINDPIGEMQGSYTFKSDEGLFFDVEIESFQLSFKDRLNVH